VEGVRMFSAPHTATAQRMVQTFNLGYDNGTSAFTPGATLYGVTSRATATILSTGDINSGTLIIFDIVGVFQDNEVITDTEIPESSIEYTVPHVKPKLPQGESASRYNILLNNDEIGLSGAGVGFAVVNGNVSETLDVYGQPSKTPVTSLISCRFFNTVVLDPVSGKVVYSEDNLGVMYGPGTNLLLGDTLTSTDAGYAFTFTVSGVKPSTALGILHHYTAKLTRVS
jgi:hypothetical protein